MRSTISIIACVAALAAAGDCAAQSSIYRWVDKDGNVHFSDAAPPEDATSVTRRRMGGGQVEENQLPYATQVAVKRSPVTLFSSSGCGELCASARQLLASRGIPYSERNPEASPADADALRKLIGALEVPVLLIGATTLKGYNEDTWSAALDSAGYPRTLLPGQVPPRPPTPPVAATPAPAAPK